MIMDPRELRMLGHKMNSQAGAAFEQKLIKLHAAHLMNSSSLVIIPQFWCETIFYSIEEMLEEFPQLKLGSILEVKNKLRLYTIPSATILEKMKVELYNKIDTLILDTVGSLLKGSKKPFFMT